MTYKHSYRTRSNIFRVALENNGIPVKLAAVQKMKLLFANFTISSDEHPEVFHWGEGNGRVTFSLGHLLWIKPGKYLVRLVVYDPSNPNGIDFGSFALRVFNTTEFLTIKVILAVESDVRINAENIVSKESYLESGAFLSLSGFTTKEEASFEAKSAGKVDAGLQVEQDKSLGILCKSGCTIMGISIKI